MSKETIWNRLKAMGLSDVAAAAMMGNMEAESNCEANRIQGDFTNDRRKSRDYTVLVDDGSISREDFIHHGPGGGGYGLCQWTYYSRKAGLYDMAKRLGKSVGDEVVQLEWLAAELLQGEYAAVLRTLRSSANIRECSDAILKGYEKPADQSEHVCVLRARYAQQFYDEFHGSDTVTGSPALHDGKAERIVQHLKEILRLLEEMSDE